MTHIKNISYSLEVITALATWIPIISSGEVSSFNKMITLSLALASVSSAVNTIVPKIRGKFLTNNTKDHWKKFFFQVPYVSSTTRYFHHKSCKSSCSSSYKHSWRNDNFNSTWNIVYYENKKNNNLDIYKKITTEIRFKIWELIKDTNKINSLEIQEVIFKNFIELFDVSLNERQIENILEDDVYKSSNNIIKLFNSPENFIKDIIIENFSNKFKKICKGENFENLEKKTRRWQESYIGISK